MRHVISLAGSLAMWGAVNDFLVLVQVNFFVHVLIDSLIYSYSIEKTDQRVGILIEQET